MATLAGQYFERLYVLRRLEDGKWLCLCDCGGISRPTTGNLRGGNSRSCGCLHREQTSKVNRSHGMANSREHAIWVMMKQRCINPKDSTYSKYGGRGITVCERWLESFENFFADMGPRPEGCQIDRIDNDGPYCPENCQWADRKAQCRNRRNSRRITHNGKTATIAEWSEVTGIPYFTLIRRVKHYGWSPEKALTTPVDTRKSNRRKNLQEVRNVP